MRLFSCFLRAALVAALVLALTAPFRATAQAGTQAPPASKASPAGASNSASVTPATEETPKSEEEQEQAFLHASHVQSLARILHLSLNTTMYLMLAINFAIIFFAIAVPVGRMMPKIIRKRSQNLSHDLKTARAATTDAQARLSAVEAKLAGLGEEIEKFRAQVEQESLEDEKKIKASLGEESARIVAAAEQEIGVAATQARRSLRSFAADLAIEQAASQVKLTPETDRALIAEFVAGVAADAPGKGGKN
jgi:F-type H+-transporting ATPase subunit b